MWNQINYEWFYEICSLDVDPDLGQFKIHKFAKQFHEISLL